MKKLTAVLALLALVPAFSPASADALTLAQRVERLEGKLNCLRRVPVNEYADFAGYGDPADGPNATDSYATARLGIYGSPARLLRSRHPRQRHERSLARARKFGLQTTPVWWRATAHLARLRQLARVE